MASVKTLLCLCIFLYISSVFSYETLVSSYGKTKNVNLFQNVKEEQLNEIIYEYSRLILSDTTTNSYEVAKILNEITLKASEFPEEINNFIASFTFNDKSCGLYINILPKQAFLHTLQQIIEQSLQQCTVTLPDLYLFQFKFHLISQLEDVYSYDQINPYFSFIFSINGKNIVIEHKEENEIKIVSILRQTCLTISNQDCFQSQIKIQQFESRLLKNDNRLQIEAIENSYRRLQHFGWYGPNIPVVLILGGGGLIGSALVDAFSYTQYHIISVNNREHLDLRENGALNIFDFINIRMVYFLACEVGGAKFILDPESQNFIKESNIQMYNEVFRWLNRKNIPFIWVDSTLSSADFAYGKIKNMGLEYVQNNPNGRAVKFWNVYGPERIGRRSHVVSDWIYKCLHYGYVQSKTNGNEFRQFTYVQDIAKGLIVAGQIHASLPLVTDMTNGIWNSLHEISSIIQQFIPSCQFNFNTKDSYLIKGDEPDISTNFHHLWKPTNSLYDGIHKTVYYYRSQHDKETHQDHPFLSIVLIKNNDDLSRFWFDHFINNTHGCEYFIWVEIILVDQTYPKSNTLGFFDNISSSSCTFRYENTVNSAIRHSLGEYIVVVDNAYRFSSSLFENIMKKQLRSNTIYLSEPILIPAEDENKFYATLTKYRGPRVIPMSDDINFINNFRFFILSHRDIWHKVKGMFEDNYWYTTQVKLRSTKSEFVIFETPLLMSLSEEIRDSNYDYIKALSLNNYINQNDFLELSTAEWDKAMYPSFNLHSIYKNPLYESISSKSPLSGNLHMMVVALSELNNDNRDKDNLQFISRIFSQYQDTIVPFVYGLDLSKNQAAHYSNIDNILLFQRDAWRHESPPFSFINYPLSPQQIFMAQLNATYITSSLIMPKSWNIFIDTLHWQHERIDIKLLEGFLKTLDKSICWQKENKLFMLALHSEDRSMMKLVEQYSGDWTINNMDSNIEASFISKAQCLDQQPFFISIPPVSRTSIYIRESNIDNTCYVCNNRHIYRTLLPSSHITSDERPRICIGVPSLTKIPNLDWTTSDQVTKLFYGLLSDLTPRYNESKYWISFYIGYDLGDPNFDNSQQAYNLMNIFNKMASGYAADLHLIPFPRVYGDVVYIWNNVLMQGYVDGCEYFYQLCDDVTIQMNSNTQMLWPDAFTKKLINNTIPNVGMVGENKYWTQPFVHRTHFEIFGSFYPHRFRNWFGDTWMFQLYKSQYFAIERDDYGWEHSTETERPPKYRVCTSHQSIFAHYVMIGRKHLIKYLNEKYHLNLSLSSFPNNFLLHGSNDIWKY